MDFTHNFKEFMDCILNSKYYRQLFLFKDSILIIKVNILIIKGIINIILVIKGIINSFLMSMDIIHLLMDNINLMHMVLSPMMNIRDSILIGKDMFPFMGLTQKFLRINLVITYFVVTYSYYFNYIMELDMMNSNYYDQESILLILIIFQLSFPKIIVIN